MSEAETCFNCNHYASENRESSSLENIESPCHRCFAVGNSSSKWTPKNDKSKCPVCDGYGFVPVVSGRTIGGTECTACMDPQRMIDIATAMKHCADKWLKMADDKKKETP